MKVGQFLEMYKNLDQDEEIVALTFSRDNVNEYLYHWNIIEECRHIDKQDSDPSIPKTEYVPAILTKDDINKILQNFEAECSVDYDVFFGTIDRYLAENLPK